MVIRKGELRLMLHYVFLWHLYDVMCIAMCLEKAKVPRRYEEEMLLMCQQNKKCQVCLPRVKRFDEEKCTQLTLVHILNWSNIYSALNDSWEYCLSQSDEINLKFQIWNLIRKTSEKLFSIFESSKVHSPIPFHIIVINKQNIEISIMCIAQTMINREAFP